MSSRSLVRVILCAWAVAIALLGAGCAIDESAPPAPPAPPVPASAEPAPADDLTPLSACTATATCSTTGGSVFCAGASSCQAVDQNCLNGVRGYVKCDGAYTYCASCPAPAQCSAKQCRLICGETGGNYNSSTGQCNCC